MARTTRTGNGGNVQRSRGAAFPIGLYGTLLLALCWLLLPAVFQPVERLLLGVACVPQRLLASLGGDVALAGGAAGADAGGGGPRVEALRDELERRQWATDVGGAAGCLPPALEPLVCRVLGVEPRLGGGGLPCELRLDRSYEELGGCADFVTKGGHLLGFLARPGIGTAIDDTPQDRARVLLLNHPQSRPVAAAIAGSAGAGDGAGDGDGDADAGGGGERDAGALRCVVDAAAVVDPAPLRTVLHEDPYSAARLQQGGATVRTLQLAAPWVGALPGGLLLGTSRVWGYERQDGDVLTIGVFVDPAYDPRALSQVVLWQSVPGAIADHPPPPFAPARLSPLPDGTNSRFLLATDGSVPDGAAVVQDGVCLGLAHAIAFGQALVTAFAASRQPWSLLLLPDDPALPVQELWGEVAFADRGQAWFRPRRGLAPVGGGGLVFTGGNGPHCPAGLLIGRAETALGENLLRVVVPRTDVGRAFTVGVEPEAAR